MKINQLMFRFATRGLLALAVGGLTATVAVAGESPGCYCTHIDDYDATIPDPIEEGETIDVVIFGEPTCDATSDSVGCYFNRANPQEFEWYDPETDEEGTIELPDCETDDGNACGTLINDPPPEEAHAAGRR